MRSQWEEGGHGRGVTLFGWMGSEEEEEKRRRDGEAEGDGDRSFATWQSPTIAQNVCVKQNDAPHHTVIWVEMNDDPKCLTFPLRPPICLKSSPLGCINHIWYYYINNITNNNQDWIKQGLKNPEIVHCFATFPLVVRKELQMGVVARVWLARWQKVPVLLTSVGILVTVAWTWILEQREREREGMNQEWRGIQQSSLVWLICLVLQKIWCQSASWSQEAECPVWKYKGVKRFRLFIEYYKQIKKVAKFIERSIEEFKLTKLSFNNSFSIS